MQKWEYLHVVEIRGTVVRINEKLVSEIKFGQDIPKGEKIWDFLKRIGLEGWEAVSISQNDTAGTYLLKRPKE